MTLHPSGAGRDGARLVALFVAIAALSLLPEPRSARAAPQTFNSALPVADGEFVLRGQFFHRKASSDPSPADRKVEVLGGIAVLGYGVTHDFAVFGVLPYLDKKLGMRTPGGTRTTRGTSGIGDMRFFARYTALQRDAPGRTFRIAPFAGVETPTGEDDERDNRGRLPPALQLGSGSWDPFAGVVLTYQSLDFEIDTSASYQLNTEANDFDFGDEARFDASLQLRLWPRTLGPGVPAFLYGVFEGNLVHRGKNEASGVRDRSSGGTTLLLAPGLQFVTRRWVLEAIVQLPAFQNLHGTALEDDLTVRAGFRVNF